MKTKKKIIAGQIIRMLFANYEDDDEKGQAN